MLNVFIGLTVGAFVGLAILLALGFEHEFNIGHEIDLGHEVEIGHEAGHEVVHEVGDLGQASPSILSLRLLLFFVLGFGVFGVIAMKAFNRTGIVAILIAIVGAFLCYIVAYRILKALWKQQISTQFSINSLIGTEALIVQKILPGGIGEIKGRCPKTGLENYVSARATTAEQSFEKGEIVVVESVVASVCMVQKKQGKVKI